MIDRTRPGLVTFTTSGQETQQVYSYNPGAHKGQLNSAMNCRHSWN